MLPLIAAAIVGGAVRTGAGLLGNRGQYQTGRNFINDSYANSNKRLGRRQADTRETTNESLIARGMTAGGQAPGTIATGTRDDLTTEFGLEQRDLDLQRDKALSDNKAQYNSGIMNAIMSGAQTGMSIYGMGAGSGSAAAPAASSTAIPSAGMELAGDTSIHAAMTGADHPGNWWGGINGVDPLNGAGSSWNRGGGTINGVGQTNSDFHV